MELYTYSYTYSSKIEHVVTNLQGASEKLFSWFSANYLVGNAGKCHLLTSSNFPFNIRITNTKISNVERVKLLGVNFEGRLNFDYHLNTLLKKANQKSRSCESKQLHGHKKTKCSNECFYNISVFLLYSYLNVP